MKLWQVMGIYPAMKKLFVALLLVTACNCDDGSIIHTVCPDGSKCVIVDCSLLNDNQCTIQRGRACPAGYDIVKEDLIKCHTKNSE